MRKSSCCPPEPPPPRHHPHPPTPPLPTHSHNKRHRDRLPQQPTPHTPVVVCPSIHKQQVSVLHLPVVGCSGMPIVQNGCKRATCVKSRQGGAEAGDERPPRVCASTLLCAPFAPPRNRAAPAWLACVGPAGKDGRVVRQAAAAAGVQGMQVQALCLELPHAGLDGLQAGQRQGGPLRRGRHSLACWDAGEAVRTGGTPARTFSGEQRRQQTRLAGEAAYAARHAGPVKRCRRRAVPCRLATRPPRPWRLGATCAWPALQPHQLGSSQLGTPGSLLPTTRPSAAQPACMTATCALLATWHA